MSHQVEMRVFNGTSFGEREIVGSCDTIEEFEECCERHAHPDCELENEDARPFAGIVAARQFTVPADEEHDAKQHSFFMVKSE